MLFFKSLAAVSALAFGASHVVAAPLSGTATEVARADASSVPQILAAVTTQLTPLVAELQSITASNATVAVVGPIMDSIKGVLTPAITEVQALSGSSLSTILASVDGTVQVTATELAQILSNLLHLVFNALASVSTLVSSLGLGSLGTLLSEVINLVVALLKAVLALVAEILDDVLAALSPLLADLSSILSGLGVTGLLTGLGLTL
ncbi:hypothetical protein BC835DRAFT_857191 [Cytidiella melzeri]|nr:hypothetical protein BC835DRAFT_857191 [Cytidiella melzeri]